MNPKKQKLLEAELKPCKCGGRLRIVDKAVSNGHFTHSQIKCEKCGAWHGGITRPEKKEG